MEFIQKINNMASPIKIDGAMIIKVLAVGLEPTRPKPQDFKSCVSTHSTMPAI